MTLLDATPPKPPRKIGRYILTALAVIVTVTINDEEPPRELLVDRKTKGLAFSPF